MRKVTGFEYSVVRILMIINIWWMGTLAYKNPIKPARVLAELLRRQRRMLGKAKLVRAVWTGRRYYWDIFNPGWPSRSFNTFFVNQLHEIEPISKEFTSLRRVLIAITKKCPLSCAHCSEGDTLNKSDVLSYDQLATRIDDFVRRGVGQLVYSGGEPLHRFDDLLELTTRYRDRCDQWIYTSGYGLTEEKAKALANAGLNGAAISLDHHDESEHNDFRHNSKSFQWVTEAVRNCRAAGILTALNVCPSREYIDSGGMELYVDYARTLDIPIVNILEPRAVGHFAGKDVELHPQHRQRLSELSDRYNFSESLIEFPSVIYPAAFRKAQPCGGGRSYLLLDYDGTVYPCPFCKVRISDVSLTNSVCQAAV
jgi:MoaA/NifB/PqqE/SkfB family radical SAM enzyme